MQVLGHVIELAAAVDGSNGFVAGNSLSASGYPKTGQNIVLTNGTILPFNDTLASFWIMYAQDGTINDYVTYRFGPLADFSTPHTAAKVDGGFCTILDARANDHTLRAFYDSSDNLLLAMPLTGSQKMVASFSSTGAIQFAYQFAHANFSYVSIASGQDDNSVITGNWAPTSTTITRVDDPVVINIDMTSTTYPATTEKYVRGWIAKISSAGTYQWKAFCATNGVDYYRQQVRTDIIGNAYFMCTSDDGTDVIIDSANTATSLTQKPSLHTINGEGVNAIITKFNTSGAFQWAAQVFYPSYGTVNISVNEDSELFFTGHAWGPGTIYAYDSDDTTYTTAAVSAVNVNLFVVKYSNAGDVQWISQIDNVYIEPYNSTANSLMVATWDGGCVLAGIYDSTAPVIKNADGSVHATINISTFNKGYLIVKYDANGNCVWYAFANGPNSVPILDITLTQTKDRGIVMAGRLTSGNGTSQAGPMTMHDSGMNSKSIDKIWLIKVDKDGLFSDV
jgi:hypothetical protein